MSMPGSDGTGGGWAAIGAAITALGMGVYQWLRGRLARQVEDKTNLGALEVIDTLRAEIARLTARVQQLEKQGKSDRAHIERLEAAMRSAGLAVPERVS
jgi:hypothetical protein